MTQKECKSLLIGTKQYMWTINKTTLIKARWHGTPQWSLALKTGSLFAIYLGNN